LRNRKEEVFEALIEASGFTNPKARGYKIACTSRRPSKKAINLLRTRTIAFLQNVPEDLLVSEILDILRGDD